MTYSLTQSNFPFLFLFFFSPSLCLSLSLSLLAHSKQGSGTDFLFHGYQQVVTLPPPCLHCDCTP